MYYVIDQDASREDIVADLVESVEYLKKTGEQHPDSIS